MNENELKKILSQENEEFKKAHDLHQQYEKELEKYYRKDFLTDAEKQREKELKKKKLAMKDRMYFLMAQYRQSLQ